MMAEALAYWIFHDDYLVARGAARGRETGIGRQPVWGLWPGASRRCLSTRRLRYRQISSHPGAGRRIIEATAKRKGDHCHADGRTGGQSRLGCTRDGLRAVAIRGRDQPVPGWKPRHDDDEGTSHVRRPWRDQRLYGRRSPGQKSVCVRAVVVVRLKVLPFRAYAGTKSRKARPNRQTLSSWRTNIFFIRKA